jgi:2-polyprenyl-3-methyl-5-hydroxy-6-metoxy-1,4-benzoquinol methylase
MVPVKSCPICGGQQLRPFALDPCSSAKLHFAQSRCTDCKLLIAQPQADDQEIAQYYAERYFEQHFPDPEAIWEANLKNYTRYELQLMRRLWRDWPPLQGGRAVDIGCGYGVLMHALREMGFAVAGCDLSAKAVNHCLSRGLNAVLGSAATLTQQSGADLAVSFQVIEHVRDPRAFTQEIVELVKPGGVVVIATEDAWNTQYCYDRIAAFARGRLPQYRTSSDHTFVFRAQHLERMLRDAGCDQVRTRSYAHVPDHESVHWKMYKGFFRALDRAFGFGDFLMAVARRSPQSAVRP